MCTQNTKPRYLEGPPRTETKSRDLMVIRRPFLKKEDRVSRSDHIILVSLIRVTTQQGIIC